MRTKVIAEIGYNHNGSIEKAIDLIDSAAALGVWAVKFQKWSIDKFPEWLKKQKRQPENSFGDTYYEHRKALEFSIEDHIILKERAKKKGLEYICSGKDFQAVCELVEGVGIEWLKLPSQRLGNNDIKKYLSNFDIKTMISTGMSTEAEILSNDWIEKADAVFHCISLYPAQLSDCDFSWLRENNFYNGYSSHETEGRAVKYAVMLGCDYIERHFTLDKMDKGSDHVISSDEKEMKRIISEIEEAELILGAGGRRLSGNEEKIRDFYKNF
jgi:sialic acid synthase SpsE